MNISRRFGDSNEPMAIPNFVQFVINSIIVLRIRYWGVCKGEATHLSLPYLYKTIKVVMENTMLILKILIDQDDLLIELSNFVIEFGR